MLKYESGCVGCQLPCIYDSCPYYRIPVNYCDKCKDYADIQIEGKDLCEAHAEEILNKIWKETEQKETLQIPWEEMSYQEQCEFLGLSYKEI